MCLAVEESGNGYSYKPVSRELVLEIAKEISENSNTLEVGGISMFPELFSCRSGSVARLTDKIDIGMQSGIIEKVHQVILTLDNCKLAPKLLQKIDISGAKQFICPIEDSYEEVLPLILSTTVDVLEYCDKEDKRVFIHCVAGVNRTALAAIAVLMIWYGMPLSAAYSNVAKARGPILYNKNFRSELLVLEKILVARGMVSRSMSFGY